MALPSVHCWLHFINKSIKKKKKENLKTYKKKRKYIYNSIVTHKIKTLLFIQRNWKASRK